MVSNCTEFSSVLQKYYLSPLYGLEFCIGFPGNLLVILGYLFCLEEWQSCNIYLFNLAVSDLIFLCTLPCFSYLYSNDFQETNVYICLINRYVLHVNLYSSILFMKNRQDRISNPWAKLSPCTIMNIDAVYILTRPLAFLHSVINPVFYFFMGDKFRNLFTSKIRKIANKRRFRRDQS
ncbi:hypothetical protein OJAV_G00130790 [Oryzias javanicus]|uniref:G-protein coupled receptors family 1 profile domain-containing protein n=1 Tax=Oryzias javanicus TaxID=123683 RepID=A0A437CPZ7_ORYJA|nr:hypothetical protein OJAV_G00130790 [Oryzias javanicus]